MRGFDEFKRILCSLTVDHGGNLRSLRRSLATEVRELANAMTKALRLAN